MKRFIILFFILILSSSAFGQLDESQMMRGAKLAEAKLPEASIVIGVNETAGGIAQPGWPIIVSAATESDNDQAPALPKNLTLQITDQGGATVQIAFELVKRPAGSDESQAFWMASESATKNLSPGEYQITVASVAGFAIEPGLLVVEATNVDHASLLEFLKIQQLLLSGKDGEAMTQIDQLTTKDPQNIDAWVTKGDILMGNDLPDEATKAYEKALELAKKEEEEPLFIQERYHAAFARSLEKRGVLKNSEGAAP